MTDALIRRWPCEDTGTQGKWHVMVKAETGVMQLQAQKHQGWQANYQKLGRGIKLFPCRFQRVHGPVDTLISDFQSPEL